MEQELESKKLLNSVLVKPAGPDCNLGCAYCFYLQKGDMFAGQKVHRMSDEILKEMVKQVMQGGSRQVSFGWQGGEPTLMGLDFYQRAVEYQGQYGAPGQVVGNGLQTNGILIYDNWASFLRETKFLVGLSLDGPRHVHDKYRKFKNGKSSWEQVNRARDVMLNKGVEVNALTVVNDYSVRFVREIYEYHKKNGLNYMQFIPCVEPDPLDPAKAAPYTVSAEVYGDFLCDLFDLWMSDFEHGKSTTSVRWFDSLFYTYVGYTAPECTLLPECGIYTVIEHNGDVFACDFFVDPEWKLGNVLTDNLTDMLNSPLMQKFGEVKVAKPPECYKCRWLGHCYGGCPKDRQGDPADNGSNHFCISYQRFFEYADERLRKLADEWRAGQGQGKPAEPQTTKQQFANVGRNDKCPCGSGKKYKNCCGRV